MRRGGRAAERAAQGLEERYELRDGRERVEREKGELRRVGFGLSRRSVQLLKHAGQAQGFSEHFK